jgi:hypothetical protein
MFGLGRSRGEFPGEEKSGRQGLIDSALREIAPEWVDQATLLRARDGTQRFSPGGIPCVFGGARLVPKAAGFADDLPGLGIGAYRIAPANPARLDAACRYEASFGIEDGDELRHQPQIWVTICDDVAGGDGRCDLGHGRLEGAEGTQIHIALDLHLVHRWVIPVREAKAAGAQRQAICEAQMSKCVADKNVTRRAKGGLGNGCVHRDHSATGGRRLSPTLKPVTNSPTRLSLLSGTRL